MSTDQNKAAARRVIEEAINKGSLSVFDQIFSSDYVDHALPAGFPPTLQGFKTFFGSLREAFPDLKYQIEQEIAEGDTVVDYVMGRGTFRNAFAGMQPTGKSGTWQEIHISRFKNGKLSEHWAVVDQMGMLVAVGAMPAPGQPPK